MLSDEQAKAAIRGVQALALLAIASSAHALASTSFGSGLRDLPPVAWILTFVLSTLAGTVALLNRIRDELRAFGALRWMGLFCASHMLGSWLAGALMFLFSIGQGWSESVTAIAIIGASFSGSVFIEKLAVKFLWKRFGLDVSSPVPLDGPLERQFASTIEMTDTQVPSMPMPRPPERRRHADPAVPLRSNEKPLPPPPMPPFVSTDQAPLEDG